MTFKPKFSLVIHLVNTELKRTFGLTKKITQ